MNYSSLVISSLIIISLSGCATSDGESSAPIDTIDANKDMKKWSLHQQHTLGLYVGVQVLGLRVMPPMDGYCRLLTMTLPQSMAHLNLTFISEVINTTAPSYGILGISARSEDFEQWYDYPSQTSLQSYADEVKKISIEKPKAGKWIINTFTDGPVYNAQGNLTIELQGEGQRPDSLNVEMWDSFTQPCTDQQGIS